MSTKTKLLCIAGCVLFVLAIPAKTLAAEDTTPSDPNSPLIQVDGHVILNFHDALVEEILDYLSEAVGLIIIAEDFPETRINLISKQPLDIDEVVALLNTVMKEQDYAAIRVDRTLRMVPISDAKQQNLPVTTGSDPDKIPSGDEIVTHIIPIQYANAARLREDISDLLPVYAVLSANEASNSLIITDTTSNIKRICKIVKAVDTQMSSVVDVRVFRLKYADAENTAELINDVFQQQASRSGGGGSSNAMTQLMDFAGGMGGGRGGQNRGGGMGTGGGGGTALRVIASADDITNSVVVSGPSEVLDVIAKVIAELDANPLDERALFVYRVQNATAANLQEILNNLFSELQNINRQATTGTGRGGGTTRNTQGGGGGGTSSSSSVSEEVYIEADEDTNTLLIMTSSRNYEKIKAILEELDVPVPQVLIKILVAEVTVTDGIDIGVELSWLNLQADGDSQEIGTTFPPPLESGLTTQILQSDLTATLRALQTIGKTNILSRPYILTRNNQTATINVGKEVPYVTNSQVSDTGNITTTFDYRNVGIILEVTPTINEKGLVIMDVNPEISALTAEKVQVSETLSPAVFATRSTQSQVAVQNGQSIVIGGLMEDIQNNTVSKVPILGDIPLIGELFKRTQITKGKTELLIFLTPQVASDIEVLKAISEHERGNSEALENKENQGLQGQVEQMESVYTNDTETE